MRGEWAWGGKSETDMDEEGSIRGPTQSEGLSEWREG